MKSYRTAVLLALVLLSAPVPASAHTLLSELLLKILLSDIVLAPPAGPFSSHEAHFQPVIRPGEVAAGFEINQLEVPLAINSIMAAQLATIPLGSSSGGFSYTFDPGLGTFSRQSSTFGSAFVERALTAGRGRWNAGFNFQRATYDTLEGLDLDNGAVRVYLTHQDCCGTPNSPGVPPNPFFEGDVIENRMSLDLTSSTFSAFLNYGITDRLDVGLVVPFVTIDMNASVRATVMRLATASNPAIHQFEGGATEKTFSESSRAQGLGDILLRTKFRFLDAAGGGLAAGVDVRVPTGDSEQLLGTGGAQLKLALIGSMAQGPFSPHVNMGYTFSRGGNDEPLSVNPNVPDEFSYAAGFDTALHPRLTFAADILGRTLRDLGRLVPTRRQFPFVTQSGEFGTATFEEFTRRPGDLNLLVGVAGIRYNPRGNLLISAQMLVPVTEAGLRDKITPVIGIDYSF
ncbi:MAG TPA: transporter [Vicinamibacterales bacterium]|jgi:hypothetical protein|nr:transporter [Vicinamibacterales bacterium]